MTFATDNATLACFDFDWGKDDLILPAFAVDEILRIGQDPVQVWWDDTRVEVEYADGSWMSSRLVEGAWPGTLQQLYEGLEQEKEWLPVPGDMQGALDKLKPFFPDAKLPVVHLSEDGVATADGHSWACFGLSGLPTAAYRLESLSLVVSLARSWNPGRYPGATPWRADGVVGLLSGVRVVG